MSDRDRYGVSGDDDTVSLVTPPPNATIGSGAYPLVIGAEEPAARAAQRRAQRRSSLLVVAEQRSLSATLDPLMRGGGLASYEITVASEAVEAMRHLQDGSWQAYIFDEPSFALLSWLPPAERACIERRSVVITELEGAGPIALSNALTLPAARLNRFSLDNALWQVMRHQHAQPSQAPAGDSLYDVLLRLARTDLGRAQDLTLALRPLVEAAAGSLRVGRASVWQLVDSPKRLRCLAIYDARAGEHGAGLEVPASTCPVYCMSLHNHRIMAIEDALRDPRSSELADHYLAAAGIGALLDAPLYLDGEVVGVLCCAHTGGTRRWTDEEERAAATFADYAQLVLMAHKRRVAETELAAREAELAQARELDALGRMAAGVAHEFSNLLTVVSGRAEVLVRGLGSEGPAERLEDARAVMSACARAETLVNRLRTLARGAPPVEAPLAVSAESEIASTPPRGEPPRDRRGQGALLVVDDDDEVRGTIAGMLSFFGFEVVEAASAHAAIRAFGERHRTIDLVLLDLVMPGMGGRDCFRALRLIDPAARCLLVSAQPSDDAIGECLASGALGLVRKPFTMAGLVRAVEEALRAVRRA